MLNRGTTTARGYGWRWQKLSAAILRCDRHTCRYCGGHATTVDHITPKSKGGTDAWNNLVACCRKCNGSKQDNPGSKQTEQPRPRFSRRMLT
jgi:5-methylcytosine-specific restriction endonuclease McrA